MSGIRNTILGSAIAGLVLMGAHPQPRAKTRLDHDHDVASRIAADRV
jgi:hypothetical protein